MWCGREPRWVEESVWFFKNEWNEGSGVCSSKLLGNRLPGRLDGISSLCEKLCGAEAISIDEANELVHDRAFFKGEKG